MSYIIKNNDPLINLKLTDTGRRNLSSGELDFSTFSLGDGEMDYSNPTSKLINILRPTDNNHDILFPVAYNGSTYKVPITSITSFPNIVYSPAKSRGFFSGSTYNLIDPTLSSLYNLSGFITGGTSNVKLQYVKTTGGSTTFVNYGVGTGYTTSLVHTGYTSNVKVGDYLLLKVLQHDYYTGHTTSMTPYINADPVQYLWYNITSVNTNTSLSLLGLTNNQIINLGLDRATPNFTEKCRVKGYVYPGKNTISDYYDKTTPIAYWSNGSLSFTPIPGQETIVDVPVWNMNIVNIRDIVGIDASIYKSREYSVGYNYMGTAVDYGYLTDIYTSVNPNTVVTGVTTNNVISGYTQTVNKIGIIHYTNNTIENFYGEGLYENTLVLTIPYLMWHKEQFGGTGLANTIGYQFVCDSTLKYLNGKVPYYDLVDQETNPTVVGKVMVDQKIIIIENPELLSSLSFKANRNWTLPTPQISLVDIGHCVGANIAGSVGVNESIHITYLFTNASNVTGIHCESYQTVDNYTTKAKDVLFQFPKDATNPLYSELSYIRDYGDENGLGFSVDNVYLLWQKTEIGGVPDPMDWRKFNISRFVGTSGCLSHISEIASNFYLQNDTTILPTASNLYTTQQPVGSVLVFTGSTSSNGKLLVQASSAATVGVDGDYYQYPLVVTGSVLNTPIFKFKPSILAVTGYVQFNYLVGTTNTASTIKQQVTVPYPVPGTNTYLNGIYTSGGHVCLTLNQQPNNNVVWLFYNGALISSNNYGVFTTGTTANRRVQLNFTPSAGEIVMYYLDNSGLGSNPNLNMMTANNINNLRVYVDADIITQSVNDYYDITDVVSLPTIRYNPTGYTFGDEVMFYGNVDTNIKATIYKTLFTFNVLPNTFITSSNPTFNVNSDKVAFTDVGIYDIAGDLVAIGKFSQPITRKYNSDLLTIQATIDF